MYTHIEMKNEKTKVLSFRVPVEVAEKFDRQVEKHPMRSRQKLLEDIVIPAIRRYERKQAQQAAA